jgi:hypothetical protein
MPTEAPDGVNSKLAISIPHGANSDSPATPLHGISLHFATCHRKIEHASNELKIQHFFLIWKKYVAECNTQESIPKPLFTENHPAISMH